MFGDVTFDATLSYGFETSETPDTVRSFTVHKVILFGFSCCELFTGDSDCKVG